MPDVRRYDAFVRELSVVGGFAYGEYSAVSIVDVHVYVDSDSFRAVSCLINQIIRI